MEENTEINLYGSRSAVHIWAKSKVSDLNVCVYQIPDTKETQFV